MPSNLAPEPILRAALRVLFIAAACTRNWTLGEEVSRKQINDLWEAIHEIPSVITSWRGNDECMQELRMYLQEYDEKWESPQLKVVFDQFLEDPELQNIT